MEKGLHEYIGFIMGILFIREAYFMNHSLNTKQRIPLYGDQYK